MPGNHFYALVTGIWRRIGCVCVCLWPGNGTRFRAKNLHFLLLARTPQQGFARKMPIINLSLCLRVRVRGHVSQHLGRPVISCRLSFQGCVLFLLVLGWARVLSAPITNSDAGQQLTARPTVRSHFSRRSNVTLTRGIHRQQLFIFHLIWAAQFQQSLQLLYYLFIYLFVWSHPRRLKPDWHYSRKEQRRMSTLHLRVRLASRSTEPDG